MNNWNLSIFKDFTVPWFGRHQGWWAGENAILEFRSEFFNVWNHTQFNGVGTVFVVQSGSNTAAPNNGFGQVNSARDPREVQFALKLTF